MLILLQHILDVLSHSLVFMLMYCFARLDPQLAVVGLRHFTLSLSLLALGRHSLSSLV